MTRLSDTAVEQIAVRLAGRVSPSPPGKAGPGLFAGVDDAVGAATLAHRLLQGQGQESREAMIASMRETMLRESESLARLAHEETGLGRYDDKVVKNRLVTRKTPGVEQLRPAVVTGDRGLTLTEPAPYGVIGAITPVTNPSSTLICNAIGMVAAGNAVVFNTHPSAKKTGNRTVTLLNDAIMRAGGPANLVTTVADPTIESAQALMQHDGVRLLVVTGGAGVVKQAMTSGKRAICAGPGNPPVVVDETADIAQAARGIVCGASFDNNVICVDEKEVFAVDEIADELIAALQRTGAHLVGRDQLPALEAAIFEETRGPRQRGVVRKDLIGKNAAVILDRIGISVPADTRLVIVDVPPEHPLVWTEQMMPVIPIVRTDDADQAIDLALSAEGGKGHTASMYSKHLDRLSRMAREINCSIFIKNAPCYAGLGEGGEGFSSFTIASPTGEGLTGPLSFSRLRRCVLVDHFRIV